MLEWGVSMKSCLSAVQILVKSNPSYSALSTPGTTSSWIDATLLFLHIPPTAPSSICLSRKLSKSIQKKQPATNLTPTPHCYRCSKDQMTVMLENGDSQHARFSFPAFRFLEQESEAVSTYYLHCITRLCEVSKCNDFKVSGSSEM